MSFDMEEEEEGMLISLALLPNDACLIEIADFIRVKKFERNHPEIYKSNIDVVLVATPDMGYIDLATCQMTAYNWIFYRPAYKKELLSYSPHVE